jgi:hypothetical protein
LSGTVLDGAGAKAPISAGRKPGPSNGQRVPGTGIAPYLNTTREKIVNHVGEWTIRIYLFEHDEEITARAVLETGSNTLTGEGIAHRNRKGRLVPEIANEVAAAEALSSLARQLATASESDTTALAVEHALGKVDVE